MNDEKKHISAKRSLPLTWLFGSTSGARFVKVAILNAQAKVAITWNAAVDSGCYTGERMARRPKIQEGTANEIRGYKSETEIKEKARAILVGPPGRESY